MKTKTSKTQKSKTTAEIVASVTAPRGTFARRAQIIKAVEDLNSKTIDKRALVKNAERERMSAATGKIDADRRQRLIFNAEARRQAMRAPSECIVSASGRLGAATRYVCDASDFGRFARAALVDLIKRRDLSVEEFERQIGYSGGMVFMILRGERYISYELVGRVLARFGWDDAQMISDWLLLSGEAKL